MAPTWREAAAGAKHSPATALCGSQAGFQLRPLSVCVEPGVVCTLLWLESFLPACGRDHAFNTCVGNRVSEAGGSPG